MPREAMPAADPKDMPRTEHDLDLLMSAVEAHKQEGNAIGENVAAGFLDPSEALAAASLCDARLYDTLDQIALEREEEFVDGDPQLRGDE